MLKISLNYHDPIVQLRLYALVAIIILIACLSIFELKKQVSLKMKFGLAIAFIMGAAIIVYTLVTLRGA